MESSRIFIKGLPPTITETELRKHFSTKGQIHDIKCIPHRRIGYVGYKTPQEAGEAVKYFNRSFIRMSRINVELARPIADPSLSKARPPVSSQPTTGSNIKPTGQSTTGQEQPETNAKKRKRAALDESDPKLQEFLNVMQPAKASANKIHGHVNDGVEPPTKILAVDEAESGDEYQSIPTRPKKRDSPPPPAITTQQPIDPTPARVTGLLEDEAGLAGLDKAGEQSSQVIDGTTGTDDDWLRSRTNRLLDLIDEADTIPVISQPTADPPEQPLPPKVVDDSMEADTAAASESGDAQNDAVVDAVRKTARIFYAGACSQKSEASAMNGDCRLTLDSCRYSATDQDLRSHFEQYGGIEEIHVPSDASGNNRGMGFVLFHNPEDAVKAFQSDRTSFQGRILHVLPATAKRDQLDEFALAKLPLKQQNLIRKRNQAAASTWSWNALYMAQDAINTSVADRLGVSKSELLDPTSSDAAVKQALAETTVIQDTKAYFLANGVNLESFKSKARGDDVILVKNIYATKAEEIRSLFEEHGKVLRVLLPPTGTIAIVQFASPSDGKRAFAKLAYRRLGSQQLFLEKAPRDIFVDSQPAEGAEPAKPVAVSKVTASDLLDEDNTQPSAETTSVFVKNLDFDTDTSELAGAFQHLEGFRGALVKTKKDPKNPGQTLSMGFGFVSFARSELAEAAIKLMDGHVLRGHKLHVRASHRGLDAAEERKKKEDPKTARTLVIKNLPFQATKKDVRALLGSAGQIKAVRMPKKFNHSGRGFAFADFSSPKEAESALQALKDTHLLGRRLILQYAEADAVDPEEEIARMQKKVGGQANRVALQELTGRGRKKFSVGGDMDEGD
ncbi:MRD1-like protein [Xylariaceae sp. FL1651]|nr:MRD1-like protein [Xylariaceae sp. FL1651]